MTPQEQQLITELFARLKQTPAQAGPNPTLTLLANSHKHLDASYHKAHQGT
jgi:hypothetical protein